MRHHQNFISAFMEYTQYVEAPEEYLKWSAVSAIAGALERRTWVRFRNSEYVYPNMYIMLVGPPGLTKKSTSSKMAVNLLRRVPSVAFASSQITAAKLVEEMSKAAFARPTDINGQDCFNGSMYMYISEAATVLGQNDKGDMIRTLTDIFDNGTEGWHPGSDIAYVRATKTDGDAKVPNPCLNMLACSTPVWLVQSIGKENLESGFASRIIFIVQHGKPEREFEWDDNLPDLTHMQDSLVDDLADIATLKGTYRVTTEYKKTLSQIDHKTKDWLVKNQGHRLTGYYSRKIIYLVKLSQVMAAAEGPTMVVTDHHLNQAIELLEASEPNMSNAFGNIGENKQADLTKRVWEVFRKKQSFTSRQVMTLFMNDLNHKTSMDIIQDLVAHDKIEVKRGSHGIAYFVKDATPLGTITD